MKISKIKAVYFSPVKNTKTVTEKIASVMAADLGISWEAIDFTLPASRNNAFTFAGDELVVFGVPTYAGRIPNKALPFVQTLFTGNNTPAVAVVTFGNRNYDSSLTELCQELDGHGFKPFAAGAFVCSHVMSDKLAPERPDNPEDMAYISAFASKAASIVSSGGCFNCLKAPVVIPGREEVKPFYTPLQLDGTPAKFLKAKPVTNMDLCDNCGICAQVCPLGSIDPENVSLTPGICIKCRACTIKCPKQARYFDDPSLLSHIAMLESNYTRRAESETYFSI